MAPVGAAEGCDLLILFFRIKIKRSQPSAAPTGIALAAGYPDLVGAAVLAAWVVLVVITVCCFHG
jgi:hypothetical protein